MALAPPAPIVNTPNVGNPLTRVGAIQAIASQAAYVHRIDRISAKLTTWGAYQQANGEAARGKAEKPGFTSDQSIWLVAVGGEVTPQFARGLVFPWGLVVLDGRTGVALESRAGPTGNWPSYFDSIVDLDAAP
jgi:hypothetical protein